MEDQLDQEFIQEAGELLEQTEEALLEMESKKSVEENFKTSMRCLHTLKGAFGMFGLDDLEGATHHYEDILKKANEEQRLNKDVTDYLLQGLDELKGCLLNQKTFSLKLLPLEQIKSSEAENNDKSHVPTDAKQAGQNLSDQPFVTPPKVKEEPTIGLAFVVEDEDDIRKYMVKKLNQNHIRTFDYDDALQALEEVEKHKPDLIITDLKMPKMNGMDFITELRKTHPQIPVIIASAYVTKEACIEALSHGASGIIEKPFEAKDLLNMAKFNIMKYKSYKLLNQSLRHMQFQFSDLMNFLTEIGQHDRREILQNEFQTILVEKRKLDKFII